MLLKKSSGEPPRRPLEMPTVWLVEQNEEFRRRITSILEHSEGIFCEHSVATCDEIYTLFHTSIPPDVLLLGLDLPCMESFDGIRRVRALAPSTAVLVLARNDEDENVYQAILAGATGYLLKEASDEKILGAVGEIFRGGASMEPHVAHKVLSMFAPVVPPGAEYLLTERERDILRLIAEGMTKKQIGENLFISYFTVDTHIKNIYFKMHVHSKGSAVAKGYKNHIL